MRRLVLSIVLCFLPLAVQAEVPACQGRDLIAALPEAERLALRAAADAAPFPQGNFWRARRDGQTVTLAGTYHLDDPRHDATLAALEPVLGASTRLLVEAGPSEEAELVAHIGRNPDIILLPQGATLPDLLPAQDWADLSDAMRARGMPGFMVARFRPWYVSVLLSMPPCAIPQASSGKGLDARLIARAQDRSLPVQALEPYDTAFRIFEAMPMAAQIALIRPALALEDQAEDQMETLASAYFREDSRMIWEFAQKITRDLPGMTPEQAEADLRVMEETLMNARNRAWIPVIEAAAAEGPILAAFGALHLSGQEGVLNLLARNGWTLERLTLD